MSQPPPCKRKQNLQHNPSPACLHKHAFYSLHPVGEACTPTWFVYIVVHRSALLDRPYIHPKSGRSPYDSFTRLYTVAHSPASSPASVAWYAGMGGVLLSMSVSSGGAPLGVALRVGGGGEGGAWGKRSVRGHQHQHQQHEEHNMCWSWTHGGFSSGDQGGRGNTDCGHREGGECSAAAAKDHTASLREVVATAAAAAVDGQEGRVQEAVGRASRDGCRGERSMGQSGAAPRGEGVPRRRVERGTSGGVGPVRPDSLIWCTLRMLLYLLPGSGPLFRCCAAPVCCMLSVHRQACACGAAVLCGNG